MLMLAIQKSFNTRRIRRSIWSLVLKRVGSSLMSGRFWVGNWFAPVRKPGKSPREVISADYEKEYGVDTSACTQMPSNQVNVSSSLRPLATAVRWKQHRNDRKLSVGSLHIVPSWSSWWIERSRRIGDMTTRSWCITTIAHYNWLQKNHNWKL